MMVFIVLMQIISTKFIIKILLVDDHDLVRTGLRMMLEDANSIGIIGEASDGESAICLARELKPNVVLLDLKMPGIGGLEAARKMLRIDNDIKIIAVTACDDDFSPVRFMQTGAHGYLTKSSTKNELLHAIRAVYSGQRYVSPKIAQNLTLARICSKTEELQSSPFDNLSTREMQVALMIAQGIKAKEVAIRMKVGHKTINTYRYRIFDKLGVKGDVALARLVHLHELVE